MPLSQKHEAVALAYLADREHIGWRAYASVYPKSSQRAAETSWSELLKNPEFAARIAELGQQAAQGAVMAANEVLEELTKLARANMADFVGEDDILHSVASLDRTHAAAIQEYTVEHYVEGRGDDAKPVKKIKLKLASKQNALEALGRHHVLFTEKHVHEFGGVAERLTAALERIGDNPGKSRQSPDRRADDEESPGESREIPARGAARRRSARKTARKGERARAK